MNFIIAAEFTKFNTGWRGYWHGTEWNCRGGAMKFPTREAAEDFLNSNTEIKQKGELLTIAVEEFAHNAVPREANGTLALPKPAIQIGE